MKEHHLPGESGVFNIRQLLISEAILYKSLRLEAINAEPAMFRCTDPPEAELTDSEWKVRIKYPRLVFGLFEHDQPIGMTSILFLNEAEAYLGQSYIRKEYRGLGLSALLYKARMESAVGLQLKRLTVSHRKSNSISKAANQRAGFIFTHLETVNWLDGTTEDALYYALDLHQ
jgi:RimJ/RimL family protein N-acetyltransferase|nr:GNAT family N-acetyltransferase [Pedobacter sp. ASV2]